MIIPLYCLTLVCSADTDDLVKTTALAKEVTVEVSYQVELPTPAPEVSQVRVWLPVPRDDRWQRVASLELPPGTTYTRNDLGNRFGYLVYSPAAETPDRLVVRYTVSRKAEQPTQTGNPIDEKPAVLSQYLAPDPLLPVDGLAKETSNEICVGANHPLEKARRIYTYVFENMNYDKTEPGWGEANFARACEVGKGNCTDFHGMFLSLCRAQGIPARFEIGLELAPDGSTRIPGSYHCWALFYTDERGWTPVDISTAWKRSQAAKAAGNKALAIAEMHAGFGWLDAYRITLSEGLNAPVAPAAPETPRYVVDPVVYFDDKKIEAGSPLEGKFKRSWSYSWLKP